MVQNGFERLVDIMNDLREKCPWDKKQTIQSLRQMTLEETYELTDAILEEDWNHIKEELGDLLLHIVFYSKIATEKEKFTIDDVAHGISEKLIKRHPHVYPPAHQHTDLREVKNEEDVKQNWEQLKLKEGKKSVLSGVPTSLPSIIKAMRLQEKAKQVGFEWENKEDVWKKVEEEMDELKEAVSQKSIVEQEEELGDLLFSIINYARFLNVDADAALERTNKKFKKRFTEMESIASQQGKNLNKMSLEEMDEIWDTIKAAK
ncbi:nucleoside triphosphate pyrophosphohydrolase [Niabella ginsengisoli]|uniref:Nucleoside triphosphate pyrophosphohydrolase n=1 Tax=Niabella ginsengisoli TaxID=522298 RepID=A0ABS9SK90_9BACT|nr:nucleoside triphosphate pyrophosphohydrolase [Niabella ginsengisoli]MCH5598798.1 nucleoside triphosphate pyrophosphohydrolase [Niabella ginsengisoli]